MVSVRQNTIRVEFGVSYQWAVDADRAVRAAIRRAILAVVSPILHARDRVLIHVCQTQQATSARGRQARAAVCQCIDDSRATVRNRAVRARDCALAAVLGIPADAIPELRQRILNPQQSVGQSQTEARKRKPATAAALTKPAAGLNVDARQFAGALTQVSRAISGRTSLPILGHVLLESRKGVLRLSGTDLEIGAETTIPAAVKQAVLVAAPAKALAQALKGARGTINLDTDVQNNVLILSIGNRQVRLDGLPPQEFPSIPAVSGSWNATHDLLPAVRRVIGAVSRDESRAILTGALMEPNRLLSTDGHRAHVAVHGGEMNAWQDVIIPGRALSDLPKVLGIKDGEVEVRTDGATVQFRAGGVTLTSRLIEGKFPNVDRVTPSKEAITGSWTLNRTQFAEALRGMAGIAAENSNRITAKAEGAQVSLSASSGAVGNTAASVVAECEGAWTNGTITFNRAYMSDALEGVLDDSEQVKISIVNEQSAMLITGTDPDATKALLMPMHVT